MARTRIEGRPISECGFTLVELLVVIAIIALLLSILMPALSKARDQAKGTVCKSTFHQVGLGLAMYVEEYRLRLPPYWSGVYTDPTGKIWKDPFSGTNYNQFRRHHIITSWFKSGAFPGGPRDGDGYLRQYTSPDQGGKNLKGILGCPGVSQKPTKAILKYSGAGVSIPVYYGQSIAVNLGSVRYAYAAVDPFGSIKLAEIRRPNEMVVMTEGPGTCERNRRTGYTNRISYVYYCYSRVCHL